jgi:proteic killer suppression protein
MAIESFRHKGLKRLFEDGAARGVPAQFVERLGDMLAALDAAQSLSDVSLYPGWRLHALKGNLAEFSSLTVSGNWRLIFRFKDGDVFDVDLVDYH